MARDDCIDCAINKNLCIAFNSTMNEISIPREAGIVNDGTEPGPRNIASPTWRDNVSQSQSP